MRNTTIFLAAILATALSGQAARAQSAGSAARNLLPMGGDTGHSAVDVRQGLIGNPIAVPRYGRSVVAPDDRYGPDPKTTGSIRPHDRFVPARHRWGY